MYLEEIVSGLSLEDSKNEFKVRLNREDIKNWLKTVAGFANAKGGFLYVGVEDKTNKLIGFERKEADNERNYFNNQVNEHLFPRPNIEISFPSYFVNEKERFIICIHVLESTVKPVLLKYKGEPIVYIRRDGFTGGATYEEISDMVIKSKNVQYDLLISDIKYDQSKFEKLRDFYSKHNDGKQLSEKLLRSIGFFEEKGYLANGAVLFMDDYNGNKTTVQCSAFSGFNKGSERLVTINKYNGDLVSSIQYIMEFVNIRMNHSMLKLEDSRINIDAYPQRALFEGVINAIAHRDYNLDGTQVQVDMYRDRLEISSPGSFYKGEQLEKTYDLSKIISKRRNELICAVLVSCNVMEAAGTGFDKIVEDYSKADQNHRPFIYSKSDHFTLVLPDLTYQQGIVDDGGPILSYVPIENSSTYDDKILRYCYKNARKVSEIVVHLGISDSTYFRKNVLENLVRQGYLIKSKKDRATIYLTDPQSVKAE